MSTLNKALFLDRDGILNELVFYDSSAEWESPRNRADVTMIDGISDPLRRLAAAGWQVFIVTNQPSYAKGKTTMRDLIEAHDAIIGFLTADGVPIINSYECFHHPDAIVPELRVICDCRKPQAQFLREAASEFSLDLASSWMVGDSDSDLACGRDAGCHVALIENPHSANKRGAIEPDVKVGNLEDLATLLIAR